MAQALRPSCGQLLLLAALLVAFFAVARIAVGLVALATLMFDELHALALVLEGGVGELPPAPLLALVFARLRL